MTGQEAIAAILDSPAAPKLVAELDTAMRLEQRRRQYFYAELDDEMKAEFINGEVIVQSPVKIEHAQSGQYLLVLLDTYVKLHKLGFVGYEKVLIALTRNDYEPDLVFFGTSKTAQFSGKGMWKFPVPDFVVEILSDKTASQDRGVKFGDYEQHGIAEYWIIDPEKQVVEQYLLEQGAYTLHQKISEGTLESSTVRGFRIPVSAIFNEEDNLAALTAILTNKHAT